MTKRPEMLLWLSDSRGVYIPRDFAQSFADRAKSVSDVEPETWEALEAGPDNELYWDHWQDVLDYAVVTDNDGNKFRVYQDGDCWLIPEGMEWNEETDSFDWPDERETSDEEEEG